MTGPQPDDIDAATAAVVRAHNGGECPGCGRVMSVREGAEQGMCNDCLDGLARFARGES